MVHCCETGKIDVAFLELLGFFGTPGDNLLLRSFFRSILPKHLQFPVRWLGGCLAVGCVGFVCCYLYSACFVAYSIHI